MSLNHLAFPFAFVGMVVVTRPGAAQTDVFDARGFYCTPQPTTGLTTIRWALLDGAPDNLISNYSEIGAAIQRAGNTWAAEFSFTFERVRPSQAGSTPADVFIAFELRGGDFNPLWGTGHGFATVDNSKFPCMPRLIVLQTRVKEFDQANQRWHFPEKKMWSVSDQVPSDHLDVESIVLHELGHVLFGTGHICGLNTCNLAYVMDSRVTRGLRRRALTQADIQWARSNAGKGGLVH